jgi:predicted phosphodiesterase
MRVFALSDLHVDYEPNLRWVEALSATDHRDDLLILAGDLTDRLPLLAYCLQTLVRRFRNVIFVPGNHELWVSRDAVPMDSLRKFEVVMALAVQCGASVSAHREAGLSILPLLGWYDDSFGVPDKDLRLAWMDYRACRWPHGYDAARIAAHFDALNEAQETTVLGTQSDPRASPGPAEWIITCSHFLPRIDVMPEYISDEGRMLYPVLGSRRIEARLRRLGARIHVYGHSHVNRDVEIDGVRYVNNAFGYPRETRIAARRLLCIHER